MTINVAVLTVSDTSSGNASYDKSGPAIKEAIQQRDGYQVVSQHCHIVPDDAEVIFTIVRKICDSGAVDWLISTGGTGFGVRDVTPEAIAPIIERPAPGLVHLMLASSLKHTPLAALSRPVAGTCKNTLITTLPGSVKAVRENLEALFQGSVVDHAIELIKGGSGRQIHSRLASSDGQSSSDAPSPSPSHSHRQHHHHHHHHHGGHSAPTPQSTEALTHDPAASVSLRHRQSPFPVISFEDALQFIKEKVERLPIEILPVGHKLAGYILAEDVYAPQDVPRTYTTNVDGYALRSHDAPGIYTVLTAQTHALTAPLPESSIFRVNTGGPVPQGADTVIMVEDTELISTSEDVHGIVREEKEVRTLAQIPLGENVRTPGSDVRKGDLILRALDRITHRGGEVGTLAFVGRTAVKVYRKPVVALLSTGNELVDLQSAASEYTGADGWGGIYDTNRPSLQAALESMGYEVLDLGIVVDDIQAHVDAMQRGIREADIIITTGGTSMGPTDLLKPVIERYLNGTIHFGRVGIKPGKPTTFATVSAHQGEQHTSKPIFALPGNPASALVTFYVFVVPALRRLGGWPETMCELPRVQVQVQNAMELDARVEFHRAIIKSSIYNDGTRLMVMKAYSTGGQRSSRVASLCGANGLVILPSIGEAKGVDKAYQTTSTDSTGTSLKVGDLAQAILIGEIETD